MKYNPSVKLCSEHIAFNQTSSSTALKHWDYLLLGSTFITYYPHKTQGNKIHLILHWAMLNSITKNPEFAFNASLVSELSWPKIISYYLNRVSVSMERQYTYLWFVCCWRDYSWFHYPFWNFITSSQLLCQ